MKKVFKLIFVIFSCLLLPLQAMATETAVLKRSASDSILDVYSHVLNFRDHLIKSGVGDQLIEGGGFTGSGGGLAAQINAKWYLADYIYFADTFQLPQEKVLRSSRENNLQTIADARAAMMDLINLWMQQTGVGFFPILIEFLFIAQNIVWDWSPEAFPNFDTEALESLSYWPRAKEYSLQYVAQYMRDNDQPMMTGKFSVRIAKDLFLKLRARDQIGLLLHETFRHSQMVTANYQTSKKFDDEILYLLASSLSLCGANRNLGTAIGQVVNGTLSKAQFQQAIRQFCVLR